MRRILSLFLLFSLSLLSLPSPAHAQGGEEGWMLGQLNALRAQSGLGPLTWNGQLAAAAAAHSRYLANNAYVGPHIEADGSSPQSRGAAAGYGGRVGENVVGGSTATAQWAWNWWINSAVHLNNMLGPWNEVGIAVAEGSYGRWYTMDFGDGGSAQPPPAQAPVNNTSGEQNPTNNGGGAVAGPPRPTRPPPPTATPTITLTPSLTFTPRASFTPLPTGTSLPPTETPIVMELIVPADASATPTLAPTLTTEAPLSEPTAVAVAVLPTSDSPPVTEPKLADAAVPSPSPARTVIPIVIGLQLVIVGLLAVRAVLRRAKH